MYSWFYLGVLKTCAMTLKTVMMTASEVYGLLLVLAAALWNVSINTQIKKAAGSLSFKAETENAYLYSLPVTNTSWRVWTHSGIPVSGIKGCCPYEIRSAKSSLVGQEVPKCRKQILKNCHALSCVTQGTYSSAADLLRGTSWSEGWWWHMSVPWLVDKSFGVLMKWDRFRITR